MELNKNRTGQNPMEEKTGVPGQGQQHSQREGFNEQEYQKGLEPELGEVGFEEDDISIDESEDTQWEQPNRKGGAPQE
ncbi:MAG: hypothetical protein EOP56_12935 [Sphingobacteriales bacterium]|nr:MAG: hypothetical protein EOP56_12935 [Sphingobacteriales bacterium]